MNPATFTAICRTTRQGTLVLDATWDNESEMWRVEARDGDKAPMATFHQHPLSGMTVAYEDWLRGRQAEQGYRDAKPFIRPGEVLLFPGTPPRPAVYEARPRSDMQPAKEVKTVKEFCKTWIRNNPDLFQVACDDFYATALAEGKATRQLDDGARYYLIAWDMAESNGELEL